MRPQHLGVRNPILEIWLADDHETELGIEVLKTALGRDAQPDARVALMGVRDRAMQQLASQALAT